MFAVWTSCALVTVALTLVLTRNERIRWNDRFIWRAGGQPSPTRWLHGRAAAGGPGGAQAAGPAIVTMANDIITTSLCLALSRLDGADEHGVATTGAPDARSRR